MLLGGGSGSCVLKICQKKNIRILNPKTKSNKNRSVQYKNWSYLLHFFLFDSQCLRNETVLTA